jgi:hypothetical protein
MPRPAMNLRTRIILPRPAMNLRTRIINGKNAAVTCYFSWNIQSNTWDFHIKSQVLLLILLQNPRKEPEKTANFPLIIWIIQNKNVSLPPVNIEKPSK